MFYLCREHKLATKTWWAFHGHWNFKHAGQPIPDKATVTAQEVPEGFSFSQWKAKPKEPTRGQVPHQEQEAEGEDLTELPQDPVELFAALLRLKKQPQDKVTTLEREFRLSSWMWKDPEEIANLLKSHLKVGSEWIHTFIKQYGSSVKLPGAARMAFVGAGGGRDAFFGSFGQGESPTDRLLNYLIVRDTERPERERDEERRGRTDPETQQRLQALEGLVNQIADSVLKKQEEDRLNQRFATLEARIVEASAGKTTGQPDFLKEYLAERDKRTDDIIASQQEVVKDLGARLERAATEVSLAKKEGSEAGIRALLADDERRQKIVDELKGQGWNPRTKTPEEQQYELAQLLMPLVDRRISRVQDSMERALTGTVTPQPPAQAGKKPITGEEADRISRAMTLQEQLRQRLGG